MKTKPALITLSILTATTSTALAQAPGTTGDTLLETSLEEPAPVVTPAPAAAPSPAPTLAAAEVALVEPAPQVDAAEPVATSGKPVAQQYLHGFRIGYNVIMDYDKPTRDSGKSIKEEFGLESPHSLLLGYEGMYRLKSHSWLNVILVGNVTVAGLEQSKFIPIANGLIGAEINESFQLGVGVNLIPDPEAPAHMIVAAGWSPKVGSMYTPVHFYVVPDTRGSHRTGATVGVSW